MRVLITVPDLGLDYGGPNLSSTRSADQLCELGCPTAIAYMCRDTPERLPTHPGVQLFPIDRTHNPASPFRGLSRIAAEFRPDLIYDFGIWTGINAASARTARRLGIPWVNSPRGMLEPWALASKGYKKRLAWALYQRRLLRSAAALIATSASEQNHLQQLLPGARIVVVPNGVDLPPASSHPRQRQALFLSRLDPKKQPDLLIRTWSRLRPEGWRLVIAGPGEPAYRRELEALIRATPGCRIDLRGPVHGSDKERLLSDSALFVLPTHSENFGLAIAEALAHGLPVITTTGTPWESIAERNCGWYVPPTGEGLAQALAQACSLAPEALETLGQRSRELAREYSWQRTAQTLRTLFLELASEAG